MHRQNRKLRFPLRITISTLFIGLIVIFSAVLTWQNYTKTSDIMLSGADQVYRQATREVFLDFRGIYHSVVESINLIALTPVIDAHSLEDRVRSVEMFATALRGEPSLSAIQLGYANGDYFIVRPLTSPELRQTFAAPDTAQYVADQVSSIDEERRLIRLFYDEQLREVGREAPVLTDYDPRTRPWYRQAQRRAGAIKPYLFYFIDRVGTTITLETSAPGVVIAADVTLEQLSSTIRGHQITPDSEVVLMEADGRALAYREPAKLIRRKHDDSFRIAHLSELGSAVLAHLGRDMNIEPQQLEFSFEGRHWRGSINRMPGDSGLELYMLMISPLDELLGSAIATRQLSVLTTLLIVLVTIPIVWFVASRISGPMQRLAGEAGLISHFDFGSPIETRSHIREVDTLANSMAMMKDTISRFLGLINSLAGERDFDSLLKSITRETMQVSQADGVLTYLVDEDEKHLEPCMLYGQGKGECGIDQLPSLPLEGGSELVEALRSRQATLADLDTEHEHVLQPLLKQLGTEALTLVALPLHNRQNEAIGALCLLYHRASGNGLDKGEHQQQIAFIEALSGFAAVTLESRQLLMMQEALLNAFIKLIAGAIDAKSPYTGGHCQRVPELTRMLAEAACDSNDPPFKDFSLDEEQWDALDIASWLHDCGKVTTPEYVVDKATKLETIYDRIHEVRMRFEVLKRDAEVRYWEGVSGGGDRSALKAALEEEWQQLDEDFAFIAQCNQGGEFMATESIERLQQIAARSWTRTLDDRIGLSWEEKQRKDRTPPAPLPVQERLLDDKPEHLIERSDAERMPADNPWGFKLDVPEYKFNRGELYNLSVGRGTLTDEERFKINDHMVQTIVMLDKLPYPKHLRDVPMIAGCHHETMNGTGYPKRLTRDQMPLTARMMAIADIFEALTAADRPYKKAKTLSEAVHILSFMKNDEHIDADLFDLFLRSGTWLRYGRKFLQAEQIDEVDLSKYLDLP